MYHEQRKIKIRNETIEVDAGIILLIKWMNSYPSIKTYYSCQGYTTKLYIQKPYVTFKAGIKDLVKIFAVLEISPFSDMIECTVGNDDLRKYSLPLTYVITFFNSEELRHALIRIAKNKRRTK